MNIIIQITLGILIILWTYYVLRIVLVGVKIQTKTTVAKTTKRKKYPLKTKLLKKLRKQAKVECNIYAKLINDKFCYEIYCDCSLFGSYYKKQEAIKELKHCRIQWILQQIAERRQTILYKELVNENKELAKL